MLAGCIRGHSFLAMREREAQVIDGEPGDGQAGGAHEPGSIVWNQEIAFHSTMRAAELREEEVASGATFIFG